MVYLKYIPYLFLLAAAFFIYDAIMHYTEGDDPVPSIILAVCAVAVYFIRRKYYKRYSDTKE